MEEVQVELSELQKYFELGLLDDYSRKKREQAIRNGKTYAYIRTDDYVDIKRCYELPGRRSGQPSATINPVESSIAAAHRQRLKTAGKSSKLALIAVVNKLLRQAFAVVKFDEDFNPNYQPILRSIP
jgi:hypothetical protein